MYATARASAPLKGGNAHLSFSQCKRGCSVVRTNQKPQPQWKEIVKTLAEACRCYRLQPVKATDLLRFNGVRERDPAIDAWMKERPDELGAIAQQWFEVMRNCGDEVRELLHDGCPVACFGDAPFGYVNVFSSHVNVGFFQGARLPDPARLLQGNGKFMRHVKLRLGVPADTAALHTLVEVAYADMKWRIENG